MAADAKGYWPLGHWTVGYWTVGYWPLGSAVGAGVRFAAVQVRKDLTATVTARKHLKTAIEVRKDLTETITVD